MTEDRGQKTEGRPPSPSSVSGAGGFFLLFLLLLINFLGGAMKTSLPLEPRPVRKVFVQDSGKMSPFQRLTLGIPNVPPSGAAAREESVCSGLR